MIGSIGQRYLTATRYTLLEQARNRFAFILLIAFIPVYYYMGQLITPNSPLPFKFQVTNALLLVNGRDLVYLTLGFNAITLIVGFVLFISTRKNMRFDRRLILSGYPQPVLLLAKLTSLVVVAAVVALYASLVLFAFWRPSSLLVVWLGFFCAALGYGGLGLLLGVLVRGELEGFFLIIMISFIDTGLQNPLGNPVANQPFLKAFPNYGPMQVAVAGGFTHLLPGNDALLALAWLVGFALLGLAIFWWKTRAWNVYTMLPASHE